ncbi:hypothetical protein ABL78_2991 [Leptomonas seymouri]|uniref:Uncharacterized protein n=1 Tax=Leptomonas seymouri TaxID=5684 RepID=A0A0N1ILK9_LEPSE|nr:hypothetical protein ABL78_2991 [Leptomonas seymouri]|eukprot:KPI87913.1 hypothetical protein ABL78_2991 [Leptomonas seymouri]
MHSLCRSCGAPACIVVSAQRTHSVGDGDSSVSANTRSADARLPLNRFCVFCGCPLPTADSSLFVKDGITTRCLRVGEGPSVQKGPSPPAFVTRCHDAVQPSAAVPLSAVYAVVRALTREYTYERRLLEREVARLRADASSAQSASPSSDSRGGEALVDAVPRRDLLHLSDGVHVADLPDSRLVNAAVAEPSSPALAAASKGQYPTSGVSGGGPPTPLQYRASSGGHYSIHSPSRSRSPSIVIPHSDISNSVGAAPMAAPLPPPPPRCSHTLPRHSCSFDSDVDLPLYSPAGQRAADVKRRWSTFENKGWLLEPRTLRPPPPQTGVAALDAEELAQGREQHQAYERLRDALLQQL